MTAVKQYLYTVQVGRIGLLTDPTEEEKRITEEHGAYLRTLTAAGVGVFGGEVQGICDSRHLGVFEDAGQSRQLVLLYLRQNTDPFWPFAQSITVKGSRSPARIWIGGPVRNCGSVRRTRGVGNGNK